MSELSAFQTEARDMELAPTKRLPRVASFPHFLSTQEMGPPEAEQANFSTMPTPEPQGITITKLPARRVWEAARYECCTKVFEIATSAHCAASQ